jgi:hypothetical protein
MVCPALEGTTISVSGELRDVQMTPNPDNGSRIMALGRINH